MGTSIPSALAVFRSTKSSAFRAEQSLDKQELARLAAAVIADEPIQLASAR
jgi:hypothetical protein